MNPKAKTIRDPHGYAVIVTSAGKPIEFDTLTCNHCDRLLFVSHDTWGFCHGCNNPICQGCYEGLEQTGCIPWQKRLDLEEQRDRLLSNL